MIIWICTDMEGLSGIDKFEQCNEIGSPGRAQTAVEQDGIYPVRNWKAW